MIGSAPMRRATVLALALLAAQPAAAGCSFSKAPVAGNYGGYTFYQGLMHQKDPETGRTLNANQAVTAGHISECVQVCLDNPACTGVTYRRTSHGQCLTYAGYDFESGRPMGLALSYSSEIKATSALVRTWFQGPTCQ
ncbi:PAN domain-containing protein [Parasedimentitalea psychrophila]|uniref:PAN domain-containing protein n=1 Tax=Parasedimentitalea psychrophila TaxID=2997337 RepID=UPI0036F1ABA7